MIDNLQTTLKKFTSRRYGRNAAGPLSGARANELDYEEFLRRLIDDELSKRKNNLIQSSRESRTLSCNNNPGKFRLLI